MAILETDYWTTPTEVVRGIERYAYKNGLTSTPECDIDVCANEYNTKVADCYITEAENALVTDWGGALAWCNPPYSTGNVNKFIDRAVEMQTKYGVETIMLLNVDPSTKYFKTIVDHAKAVVYVVGKRIRFIDVWTNCVGDNPSKPNMFVIFGKREKPTLDTHYLLYSDLINEGK